ncbi:MAG: TOBE domain-containing protein [Rhizobiaceae bacterium]
MDEPLSNLDAKLRQDMRLEIRALQERLKMTVVYVTHDQAEAMSMSDKVILMREGLIEQEGTPDELYNNPGTTFVAEFIGTPPMSLLQTATLKSGMTIKGENNTPVLASTNDEVLMGIRPEHIEIIDGSGRKGISVKLLTAEYQGADTIVTARIGDQKILVRAPGRVAVTENSQARLRWKKEDVHIFDAITGLRNNDIKALSI